jgi:hypothetical protein
MKIDTTQVLLDITGEPIMNESGKKMTLGYAISRMLMTTKADPLRAYLLGSEVYKTEGEYEVKKSDLDYIQDSVKSNENYISLVKGQVLDILSKKEEKVEKTVTKKQ